jgi:hypothetical protein
MLGLVPADCLSAKGRPLRSEKAMRRRREELLREQAARSRRAP